jgi:glucuronate isomerase
MAAFLDDDFLLRTDAARQLYHGHAASQPIFDYHCHLPPQQIAVNYRFKDLYDLWLAGDHYKWRAMRAAGVPERFCTGDAPPYEKFLAYARTVPQTLRNPLYHWTHLELRRTFGINELLDESTARSIWDRANEQLPHLTVHELLTRYKVAVVCTTDDPAEPLDHHRAIRQAGTLRTRVYPTFRPDKALLVDQPTPFNAWVDKLAGTSGIDCNGFTAFLDAIKKRHDAFHAIGGRLSDHGISHCDADDCTDAQARQSFDDARAGLAASPADAARFRSYMMLYFGRLDADRGWTKQLHLGALRNSSTRGFKTLGPDTGFDSMGDQPQAASLARYLDRLDRDGHLPKTILYNVNPTDNYMLATMAGNFQDGSVPGKIQFGSGWWFLDQKQGIEMQVDALSSVGLLSRFVGMLTDSRSFLSFPRHEYFRRVLCNLIGQDVANGELPDDMKLLGDMVADISFRNAHRYFGLDVPMGPTA